ncbi:NAD(P)-dependent glycerol-3-phosphate dehydrogenase [Oribacterium sp. oral taxon 102]|uniref:NAD(P)H-dependent glycerol-3-phosphate dehydrogenase n=1 Tax=Oribacterium sp. oral taxon 102 TaxID=671214 RepID=UPI0015B7F4F6|nr:NAD(P)H-dependent glycerol-3-phosphate dehydrogenase [Oribacterium sp. oral taxon 102]NWO21661.1 NAD(P)-dependent glycerol-3-phosphate dehydrogenase [Oribacterium sp. oral taxon 102]
MKAAVIGAGTWGTALAIVLAKNGHEVMLWSKFPAEIKELMETRRHRNLPGAVLPENITGETALRAVCEDCAVLVLAVPSIYVRETAREMSPYVSPGKIVVTVAKGIEEGSLLTMTELVEQEIPAARAAVLSGPTHAEEVSRLLPTTIVAGAREEQTARFVQDCFMNESFRVYINTDVKGVEIGAALKNVIALAAGMADGLGYGDNTKAALITRGIAEISRLGMKMGCRPETFAGLSGIGDLIVTCASMHSRNRRAGILIGEGRNYEEAMREVGQVVEGVYAAKAALELSERYEVSMPIVEKVNEILFAGKPVREAVRELMLRDRKEEGI